MKNPPSKWDRPGPQPGRGDVRPGTQVRTEDTFVVRDLSRLKIATFTGIPETLGIDTNIQGMWYLVSRVVLPQERHQGRHTAGAV